MKISVSHKAKVLIQRQCHFVCHLSLQDHLGERVKEREGGGGSERERGRGEGGRREGGGEEESE